MLSRSVSWVGSVIGGGLGNIETISRELSNLLAAFQGELGLAADDTLCAVTTFAFDIAGLELWLPLVAGARIALADRATAADGTHLAELLRSSQATVLQATPATWRLLLAAGWPGEPRLTALCGGEALPREIGTAVSLAEFNEQVNDSLG